MSVIKFDTHDIVGFFAIIALLIACACIVGSFCRRRGIPAVIGELGAGILIGPTVFGHLFPAAYASIFAGSPEAKLGFDALLILGSVFLLFVVGLEIKVSNIKAERKAIGVLGILGIVIPLLVGAGTGWLFRGYAPEGISEIGFIAIIASAFAVSALPVIARILLDLNMLKTRLGSIIIGSAAVNDIAGWPLFICALGIAVSAEGHQAVPLWVAASGAIALAALAVTLLPTWLDRLMWFWTRLFDNHAAAQGVVVLPLVFGVAVVAEYVGLHALFGAFVLGVALSESQAFEGALRESIAGITAAFFAPLYFVAVGLKADFLAGFEFGLIFTIVVLAFASKMFAAIVGGKIVALPSRESVAVGLGMAARGSMGIILASSAYGAGAVTLPMFEALIVMAVATSFFAAFIPQVLGSVLDVEMIILDKQSKGVPIDEQANDNRHYRK